MQNTKITIAIPTYDRKAYLYECLRSIENQTYKQIKIVIFDNNSPYNILEIPKDFPNLDITFEINQINIGNQKNIKKILDFKFETPYVMIFHDDDTIHPEYIGIAIEYLDSNQDVVWVGSNINFIESIDHSKMSLFTTFKKTDFLKVNKLDLTRAILRGFNIGFDSVIYRKENLDSSYFNTTLYDKWADRPFIISIIKNKSVAITKNKFVNYRIHSNQDSQGESSSTYIKNIINLFTYYGTILEEIDPRIFSYWTSDSSINASCSGSNSIHQFKNKLNIFKRQDLFKYKYITPKGLYYFIKFVFMLFFKNRPVKQ